MCFKKHKGVYISGKLKIIFWLFLCVAIAFSVAHISFARNNNEINPEEAIIEYRNLIAHDGKHRIDLLKRVLYAQFRHKDPLVRRNIVEVFGELNEPNTLDILWKTFKNEESLAVKSAALTALAEFGDKSASKYLAKALQDKNAFVRKQAALNCSDLGDKSLLSVLEEAFQRESDQFNKMAIASSMVGLGDKSKIKFIENLILTNTNPRIREFGAYLLSLDGTSFNIRISKKDIDQEKDPYVKVWSACARAVRGDNDMLHYLRRIVAESSSPLVKSHAAHALCDMLDDLEYVYPFLLELLTENDPRIRETAVEDLADFEKPQIIPILGKILLNDNNIIVREVAAWALGKIKSTSALIYLEKGLYDSHPFVRTGVVAAIYKILTAESSANIEK